MKRSILVTFVIAAAFAALVRAQAPAPVVVQAAPGANVPVSAAVPGSPTQASDSAVLKTLQEMKAANEETLRKQAATLQQLDEMEKAVEQLRIYTKRS